MSNINNVSSNSTFLRMVIGITAACCLTLSMASPAFAATKLGIRITESPAYTVSFDANDGSGISSTIECYFEHPMPSITPPKRVGYTFVGYFAGKNGGKQYYDANGKSMLDFWDQEEDATLYALWMVYAYTITFDRDGGTGGSDGVTATYGSDLAAITPPTKTGYSFAGYYDSEIDGKQYYDEEGIGQVKWDIDADITLYARWTLQISCTFPSAALIKVDMEGKIEGETLAFSSTMVEDIEITEVRSIQDANASTVFTDEAILKEARVLLSPPGNIGTQIAIPLTANRISTPTGWIIKPNSSIDVLFDLSLPEQAQIDYIANDDGIPIAKLFYEVSVIPAAS